MHFQQDEKLHFQRNETKIKDSFLQINDTEDGSCKALYTLHAEMEKMLLREK